MSKKTELHPDKMEYLLQVGEKEALLEQVANLNQRLEEEVVKQQQLHDLLLDLVDRLVRR
jgi:hypothetical protein